ncbi:MAG: hypothetical protein HY904_19215 [Deltaproteobacteria bacterium]|nr:hypothetical protein [Deltaproteobacteria bacterium]
MRPWFLLVAALSAAAPTASAHDDACPAGSSRVRRLPRRAVMAPARAAPAPAGPVHVRADSSRPRALPAVLLAGAGVAGGVVVATGLGVLITAATVAVGWRTGTLPAPPRLEAAPPRPGQVPLWVPVTAGFFAGLALGMTPPLLVLAASHVAFTWTAGVVGTLTGNFLDRRPVAEHAVTPCEPFAAPPACPSVPRCPGAWSVTVD